MNDPIAPSPTIVSNWDNFLSNEIEIAPNCAEWQRVRALFREQIPSVVSGMVLQVASQMLTEFETPAAFHVSATLNALNIEKYIF